MRGDFMRITSTGWAMIWASEAESAWGGRWQETEGCAGSKLQTQTKAGTGGGGAKEFVFCRQLRRELSWTLLDRQTSQSFYLEERDWEGKTGRRPGAVEKPSNQLVKGTRPRPGKCTGEVTVPLEKYFLISIWYWKKKRKEKLLQHNRQYILLYFNIYIKQ